MKISKKILVAVAALLVCGSAFAQTSELSEVNSAKNMATAGTILDDGDRLVNVLRWKDSEFEKNLVFGSIGRQQSIGVGFGTKAIKDSFLGAYYNGDLWGDASDTFTILYGKDQLGIAANFATGSQEFDFPGVGSIDVDIFGLGASVGYTALDGDLDIYGGLDFIFGRVEDVKVTVPTFKVGVDYRFVNKDNIKFFAGLDFTFLDTSIKEDPISVDVTRTTLNPNVRLEAGLGKDVKYVGMINVPFEFFGGRSKYGDNTNTVDAVGEVSFNVANGVSISVLKGKADLNMGINTSLPSYNFDTEAKGAFSNTYYVGSTFHMSDAIELGVWANIFEDADTKESVDDVWNTEFGFTVQVQF